MDRHRAIVLVLLLGSASAGEKNPAMVWTGAAPSGACKGTRVVAIYDTGALYCCVSGSWASCGTAPGGGSGLPSDPAACPASQWVVDQNASGVLTCSQPGWSDIASKPSTFTPSSHTHPQTDLTATGRSTTNFLRGDNTWANEDWSTLQSKPASFTPSSHTHPASDLTATGITATNFLRGDNTWANETWANLGGKPTNFQCDWTSTLINIPASFTPSAHTIQSHSDFDAAALSTGDFPRWDGSTWRHTKPDWSDLTSVPSTFTATAHTLMGATHSDVDTAATTGGDLVIRNSGNTQWTHQATGTATQVLHGGTNVVAWGAVDLANDTAATALTVAKGGLNKTAATAIGSIPVGSSTTAYADLASGAAGTIFVGTGAGANPKYLAAKSAGQVLVGAGAADIVGLAVQTCTSSSAVSCTITVARSGCLPVCVMTTSVSMATGFRASVSGTTLTCTFGTSGSNTCNCLCP